jgi:primosomal protein N'
MGIGKIPVQQAEAFVRERSAFLRNADNPARVTTAEVYAEDKQIIETMEACKGAYQPIGLGKEWVIRHPLVAASEEQSKAVRHVLGSTDFVISFKGPAGAGKTELMIEAVTAIESLSSKRVMILAPSSPSVEVLRAHGFARANTLQQFELNPSCSKR